MEKYLSIITNFGCHYTCPYCIVKENGINVPATTTKGLDNLASTIKENNITMISISGGGDPLHNFEQHRDFYKKLFKIVDPLTLNIPVELHTSYIEPVDIIDKFIRVVYHLQDKADLEKLCEVRRVYRGIVRAVYVVSDRFSFKDINDISKYVKGAEEINELSFRQMVDSNYNTMYYLHDQLKVGHDKGLWHYIEQDDYNLYYVEGRMFTEFSAIE